MKTAQITSLARALHCKMQNSEFKRDFMAMSLDTNFSTEEIAYFLFHNGGDERSHGL